MFYYSIKKEAFQYYFTSFDNASFAASCSLIFLLLLKLINKNNFHVHYSLLHYHTKRLDSYTIQGMSHGFFNTIEEKLNQMATSILGYDFGTDGRHSMLNDYIIANNYIQYSSELYSYFSSNATYKGEYLWFNVYNVGADGSTEGGKVCTTQIDDSGRKRVEECYAIVNKYIDIFTLVNRLEHVKHATRIHRMDAAIKEHAQQEYRELIKVSEDYSTISSIEIIS